MSTDDSISVIQGWSDILQQAIWMGQHTPGIIMRTDRLDLRRDLSRDSKILEKNDEKAIFFREKVWPLFTTDEIYKHGSNLRMSYPWLWEFKKNQREDFSGSLALFKVNSSTLIATLQAYTTLIDCEVVKRNMVCHLRGAVDKLIGGFLGYESSHSLWSRLIRRLEQLKDVDDDNQFLEKFMNIDYLAIYHHCLSHFTDENPRWFKESTEDKEWMALRRRIRQFIKLIPPCEDLQEVDNLSSCILGLRMKALAQSSARRERELQAEIKILQRDKEMLQEAEEKSQVAKNLLHEDKDKLQKDKEKLQEDKEKLQEDKKKLQEDKKKLQEDKGKLSKRLEVFNRVVTDISYRRLLEMLPMARQTAPGAPIEPNPRSTPEWQAFWKDAWAAAEQGKTGPLNDLYIHSNKRKRTLIEEEGGRLYGVLGANLHDFEQEYDIDMGVRDRIPGLILSVLKPQNFTADGDVDWDKEVRRFV